MNTTTNTTLDTMDIATFARLVQDVANAVPVAQRWTASKVWIKDVARSAKMKDLLLKAHRAGLVQLTRCDLGPVDGESKAMAASEIRYMSAEFHVMIAR